MTMTRRKRKSLDRALAREMLRSSFVSLFWAAFQFRKKSDGYKLTDLAKDSDNDKGQLSRWFSGLPNWQINTVSDIAEALDLEIEIRAKDRKSAVIFTPSGVEEPAAEMLGDVVKIVRIDAIRGGWGKIENKIENMPKALAS